MLKKILCTGLMLGALALGSTQLLVATNYYECEENCLTDKEACTASGQSRFTCFKAFRACDAGCVNQYL